MENKITLEEYIQGVEDTIKYWLDLHTKAEVWAGEWSLGDIKYAFESSPVLSNNYFYFEWKKAALKRHAKFNKRYYHICRECGCVWDSGYSCDCTEDSRMRPAKVYEIEEWLSEIEFIPNEDDLQESLEKDGFKAYRDALKDITRPVESECKDVLRSIKKAKTHEDKLQAILWGTRVFHVHGNIMRDYGDRFGVDYNLIDSIRDNGLNSVFSNEEIEEYIKESE